MKRDNMKHYKIVATVLSAVLVLRSSIVPTLAIAEEVKIIEPLVLSEGDSNESEEEISKNENENQTEGAESTKGNIEERRSQGSTTELPNNERPVIETPESDGGVLNNEVMPLDQAEDVSSILWYIKNGVIQELGDIYNRLWDIKEYMRGWNDYIIGIHSRIGFTNNKLDSTVSWLETIKDHLRYNEHGIAYWVYLIYQYEKANNEVLVTINNNLIGQFQGVTNWQKEIRDWEITIKDHLSYQDHGVAYWIYNLNQNAASIYSRLGTTNQYLETLNSRLTTVGDLYKIIDSIFIRLATTNGYIEKTNTKLDEVKSALGTEGSLYSRLGTANSYLERIITSLSPVGYLYQILDSIYSRLYTTNTYFEKNNERLDSILDLFGENEEGYKLASVIHHISNDVANIRNDFTNFRKAIYDRFDALDQAFKDLQDHDAVLTGYVVSELKKLDDLKESLGVDGALYKRIGITNTYIEKIMTSLSTVGDLYKIMDSIFIRLATTNGYIEKTNTYLEDLKSALGVNGAIYTRLGITNSYIEKIMTSLSTVGDLYKILDAMYVRLYTTNTYFEKNNQRLETIIDILNDKQLPEIKIDLAGVESKLDAIIGLLGIQTTIDIVDALLGDLGQLQSKISELFESLQQQASNVFPFCIPAVIKQVFGLMVADAALPNISFDIFGAPLDLDFNQNAELVLGIGNITSWIARISLIVLLLVNSYKFVYGWSGGKND